MVPILVAPEFVAQRCTKTTANSPLALLSLGPSKSLMACILHHAPTFAFSCLILAHLLPSQMRYRSYRRYKVLFPKGPTISGLDGRPLRVLRKTSQVLHFLVSVACVTGVTGLAVSGRR